MLTRTTRRIRTSIKPLLLWLILLISLLNAPEDPMWLAFSLWIGVYLQRDRLRRWSEHWSLRRAFIGWGVAFGLLVEIFAILDNLDLPPEERILLNPHPVADLIMAAIYYPFVIVTWYLLLRRYAYSARHIFLLTGAFGIVVEQSGAIIWGIVGSPVIGGLIALLILCIYGMFPLMAYWLTAHRFDPARQPVSRRHLALGLGALFVQYVVYGLVVYPTLTRVFGS